jgi:HlyD family secretion protein
VSEIASQGRQTGRQEDIVVAGDAIEPPRRGQGRRAAAVAGLVVLGAGAGVAAAASAGAFQPPGSSGSGQAGPPPATATVARQGQVLYRVDNGDPVVLLSGPVPAWRSLYEGLTGADVAQLNHDLVALGYASSPDTSALDWDYHSRETAHGVQRLESALGISYPSGSLPPGSVVFEPEALRVASVQASLGNSVGGPVLTATSDRHTVTISLDAAQQSQVKAGDPVTVTLPDGAGTPGVISSVGTVASGSGRSVTIPVYVSLTHPSAAGCVQPPIGLLLFRCPG